MKNKEVINDLAFELYIATSKIQVDNSVVLGLLDKLYQEKRNIK